MNCLNRKSATIIEEFGENAQGANQAEGMKRIRRLRSEGGVMKSTPHTFSEWIRDILQSLPRISVNFKEISINSYDLTPASWYDKSYAGRTTAARFGMNFPAARHGRNAFHCCPDGMEPKIISLFFACHKGNPVLISERNRIMKKVFASDFDGTLYFYKAEVKLPPESVAKIKEYQAKGNYFGL